MVPDIRKDVLCHIKRKDIFRLNITIWVAICPSGVSILSSHNILRHNSVAQNVFEMPVFAVRPRINPRP